MPEYSIIKGRSPICWNQTSVVFTNLQLRVDITGHTLPPFSALYRAVWEQIPVESESKLAWNIALSPVVYLSFQIIHISANFIEFHRKPGRPPSTHQITFVFYRDPAKNEKDRERESRNMTRTKMASTGAKCSRRHRFVQFLSDILAENNFLDHI